MAIVRPLEDAAAEMRQRAIREGWWDETKHQFMVTSQPTKTEPTRHVVALVERDTGKSLLKLKVNNNVI